jgi:hypothetical protein
MDQNALSPAESPKSVLAMIWTLITEEVFRSVGLSVAARTVRDLAAGVGLLVSSQTVRTWWPDGSRPGGRSGSSCVEPDGPYLVAGRSVCV